METMNENKEELNRELEINFYKNSLKFEAAQECLLFWWILAISNKKGLKHEIIILY